MGFQILSLLALIALGGFFAMAEIALISVRRSRLESLAESGNEGAKIALELSRSPHTLLSTVQCGMTLIGVLAGAFGASIFAEHLKGALDQIEFMRPYNEPLSFGLVVVVITYISLVLGELVPKTIALSNAEQIAVVVARPMAFFLKFAYPLVRILSGSTQAILRFMGIKSRPQPELSQDEIETIVAQGARAGILEKVESEMVERVFRLGDRVVKLLMTPRKNVVWIDIGDDLRTTLEWVVMSRHSQFPICEGSFDRVIGMVSIKDILRVLTRGEQIDLRALATPPLFVPENLPALKVLKQFKEATTHVAIVLDEHGACEGLVSLNDFMEAIVGEVADEVNTEEPAVVTREDGSYLVDGALPTDELRTLLKVEALFEEERGDYQTLAGMILAYLGRIPSTGDKFEWGGYTFEVVDMDNRRIDRVLVTKSLPLA